MPSKITLLSLSLLCFSLSVFAQDDESPRFSRDYSYTKEKTDPAAAPSPEKTETPATTEDTPTEAVTDTTQANPNNANAEDANKPAPQKGKKGKQLEIAPDTVFHYTYNTDRRYNVIQEIDWEEFYPAEYQEGTGEKVPLKAGQMRLQVQGGTLQIDGVDPLAPGKYQIVSKTEGKIGFVYELMDRKNQPARFKVVIDQDKYVNLLYFYSKTMGEYTFYLAEKSEEELSGENSYFTPKNLYFVRSMGNLVDKELRPYAMIKDVTLSDRLTPIKQTDHIVIRCTDTSISMPEGTFDIKEANSYVYNLEGYPSVRSMMEVKLKSKPGKIVIFLNFKQQIEFIQINDTRYFLKP